MSNDKLQDNKALIRRWFDEVWNQGKHEVMYELLSPEVVTRGLEGADAESCGHEPFAQFYWKFRKAFPDLHVEIDEMLAEGDLIAARLTARGTHLGDTLGVKPTERPIHVNCMVFARIEGGKIAEAWNQIDMLHLLQQIGALQDADSLTAQQ